MFLPLGYPSLKVRTLAFSVELKAFQPLKRRKRVMTRAIAPKRGV